MTAEGAAPDGERAPVPPAEQVSVIIPTTGRPSLLRTLASVFAQTTPVHRIIISVDGPADLLPTLPDDPRIELVTSTESRGPNGARVAAMETVESGLIGLLDDDDVWSPNKLEVQIAAYRKAKRAGADHVVVLCRMWFVDSKGAPLPIPPARTMRHDQPIASYLFDRGMIRGATGAIGSSMILFDRALIDVVPFDTSLTRHEDWDWVVRVDTLGSAEFVMVPDVLVGYTVQEFGASASSAGSWRTSESWVRHASVLLTKPQRAEVLLSVTVPLAMQQGEWTAVAKLTIEALGLRPHWRSLVFSFAHIPLIAIRRVRSSVRLT